MFEWHNIDEERDIPDGLYLVELSDSVSNGAVYLARFCRKRGWSLHPGIDDDHEIMAYASIDDAIASF